MGRCDCAAKHHRCSAYYRRCAGAGHHSGAEQGAALQGQGQYIASAIGCVTGVCVDLAAQIVKQTAQRAGGGGRAAKADSANLDRVGDTGHDLPGRGVDHAVTPGAIAGGIDLDLTGCAHVKASAIQAGARLQVDSPGRKQLTTKTGGEVAQREFTRGLDVQVGVFAGVGDGSGTVKGQALIGGVVGERMVRTGTCGASHVDDSAFERDSAVVA